MIRRDRACRSVLALLVALLLPLAACGGDESASYCSDLQKDRKEIADMLESGSPSALLGNLPMLHDLADKSPRDLVDEWQTFLGALDGLDKAIEDAGVEPEDFKDGKPPDRLSAADRKAITDAANQIGTEEVVRAASGIEQQARDVCKINLGI